MFSADRLLRREPAGPGAKRWRIATALAGLFALSAGSCERQPAPSPLQTLRFAVGNREGSFYALGDAMANAYEESIPNLKIDVQPTSGSVDTMHAIQQGTVDAGLSLANQSYAAVGGHLGPEFKSFTRLRGIAVLEVTPIHLVAGPHTTIRSVGDLRGRRLSIIPNSSTSGTFLAAEVILQSHGLTMQDVQLNLMDYSDSVSHLLDGTLDALFVTGSYPIERVSAAMQGGSRIVPLASSAVARVIEDFPFFRPVLIPSGTYPGLASIVHTIGVETLLVCRADLDEGLVYELTRKLFQIQRRITAETGLVQWVDMKLAGASPIPLHHGAIRFYRERQLFR